VEDEPPLPEPPVEPEPPVAVPPEVGPVVVLGAWFSGVDCWGGAWPAVPWVWLGEPPVTVPVSRVASGLVVVPALGLAEPAVAP
jgi:hypothetical protein